MYNNCPHDLEQDPLTGGHITLAGVGFFKVEKCAPEKVKCDHGVHIPISERGTGRSSYCGSCNPDAYTDAILFKAMAKKRTPLRVDPVERMLDAADYMSLPAEIRMRAATEMELSVCA